MMGTIQESPIATNPNKPAKQKKRWIAVVGGIVAALVLVFGFQVYKTHAFKSALRPYVLKDNILIEDMLNLHSDGKISLDDYFDKAKKNIDAREQLIQDIRLIDPGSYKIELDMYVEILKLANEYIQSEVAQYKALLKKNEVEGARDAICSNGNSSGCNQIRGYADTASTVFAEKIRENSEATAKLTNKEKDYHNILSAFLPGRTFIEKKK